MSHDEKPWLKSYKLGPYKLKHSLVPYPEVPVFKALDDAAEKFPNQTAIQFKERRIKYKEFKRFADSLSAALTKLGVQKGDKVCLFLPNCAEFVIGDFAIMKSGAAVVPTSIMRTDEGLLHEMGSSHARVVICKEKELERVEAARQKSGTEHIIVSSDEGFDVAPLKTALPKGAYEFRALVNDHDPIPPRVDIDPKNDLCELAFTGGATGVPKGVMITHFNRYTNLMQSLPWLLAPFARGIIGKASVYDTIPLFHAYGHWLAQDAVYWGLRIIIAPDPRDIQDIVRTMIEQRPLIIPTVPTQLMRMAQGKIGRMNVLFMSAAAPLPEEVRAAIKKEIGNPVAEGYGLTEAGPLSHINPSAFSRIVGFMAEEKHALGVPMPDTECKLVDPDGNDVPFGEDGEMLIRGPQLMKGYWPNPGSGLTPDGWLPTGDVCRMDEDGYFTIRDRVKDMVNVSGLKVYTTDVDDALFKHPAVLMAAAIGIPDVDRGGSERIMAIVVLKDDAKGRVTAEDIIGACRENLPSYAVPKYVQFRDSLPLTVTEKLWKKQLRDEVIQEMQAKGLLK
jgi:long-chain acyl-CoA synthetase